MSSLEYPQFFPIPSEPKKPGWDAFLRLIPQFLDQEKRRSFADELRILHRICTKNVVLEDFPEWAELEAASALLTLGQPSSNLDMVHGRVRRGTEEGISVSLENVR